jgi:hypothetical protein
MPSGRVRGAGGAVRCSVGTIGGASGQVIGAGGRVGGAAGQVSGATKPEQVESNVRAGTWRLSADEMKEIDVIMEIGTERQPGVHAT